MAVAVRSIVEGSRDERRVNVLSSSLWQGEVSMSFRTGECVRERKGE